MGATRCLKVTGFNTFVIALLLSLTFIVISWLQDPRTPVPLVRVLDNKTVYLTTGSLNTTEDFGVFGPEKGLYNFTVVTGLMDIGRGSWSHQSRTYDQYLSYLRQVLRLDVNLVVYVDRKGQDFVEKTRRGRERHTKIIVMELVDLPYYRYKDRIAEIMNSTEYKTDNDLVQYHLCESYIPEYDIITLSKMYFINRTVWENPFKTSYFVWLDGGYSHGKDVYPKNSVWIPKGLFEYSDKVTFIERDPVKYYENKTDRLHKMTISALMGGFFAGGGQVLKELSQMQAELMNEWMKKGIIDDDQGAFMLLYFKKPSLFHLVKGDWNDVFKLFNVDYCIDCSTVYSLL